MNVTCQKCGASVPPQKAFCQNCGASMSRSPTTRDQPLPNLAATMVGQKFPSMPPPPPKAPPSAPKQSSTPTPATGKPAPPTPRTGDAGGGTAAQASSSYATVTPSRKNSTLFIILGVLAVVFIGAILMLVVLMLLTR